ncbi:uncharacterized protein LOC100680122 isoform X2 [Nasonia vitripennis]|uniref:Calcineurin-binding protein cabin-1 n=1 Tax=Nasonia vitripennis TaxID=7425 RepID=A0A7M7QJI0_NASVI|nr:uncharacterized protein LOC100680122 isoform X2 [Nasonia vitripennis]
MIRITALNEVVNIDNNEEYNNALTKEAQEQVAFNEYNRALRLLIENNREEALIVLKELIDTELLNAVRKPHYRDGRSRPMLSLKYSCYKNIADIEADFKNYHAAIHNYWEAAQLDDSDVMLWYKIGCIAIKIANLEVACLAFNQGLKQNNNHWPCLDHIITVLYAIPDHKNCLYYISMALERDPTYIKGLAFCKEILKNVPELRDSIISSKNRWVVDLLSIQYDKVIADSFIKEAVVLQQKWITMSQIEIINDPSNDLKLSRPLPQLSWLELGKSLTDMYNYIVDNKLNFMCHIWFDSHEHFQQSDLNNVKKYNTMEIDTIKMSKEATCLPSSCDEINFSNYLCSQDDLTRHVSAMKAEEKEIPSMVKNTNEILYSKDFEINCSDSQGLDENILIHLNENCSRNISNDKTELSIHESRKLNSKLVEQLYENNETSMKYNMKDKVQKVKKRRRSSLCFLTQWAWSSSNTKRSSRARNVGRNNYEKDGLLEETLRRIFPPAFMAENVNLPKEELSKNDDSLDTIGSYCSAVDKENNLADETKSAEDSKPNSPINESSRYFGLEYETFDVSNFIKEYNRNKNIIMLISKFHEFLSTKWNTKWSDELIEVYIQSYLLIRDHLPDFSQFNQNVKNGSLNLDAEKTLLFCELYTDKWLLKKPCIFPMTSSNTLGIGISSDELGYLIFHSTQTELYDENNIIFFLRLLWLQAKIFLYQGEADISIRTLELVSTFF